MSSGRLIEDSLEMSCGENGSCFDCSEVKGSSGMRQPGMLNRDSPQPGVRATEFWPGDAIMPEGTAPGGEIVLCSEDGPQSSKLAPFFL